MSVYSVIASPTGMTQVHSGRGQAAWWTENTTYIACNLPALWGSNWAIWSVYLPNAVPGEIVQYLRMRGGHDYTVGAGGVDKQRIATTLVKIDRSVAAFTNVSDGMPLGNIYGTGTGIALDVTFNLGSSFPSDALRDGSFFVGVVSYSDAGNPGINDGRYRMGATTWDIYTGNSTPTPPGGQPTGYLTPPPTNANPGVYPGGQFGNTVATYLHNGAGVQQFLSFYWSIVGPAGITFASNGTQNIRIDKGTAYDPVNWNIADSGLINVAANVPPGTTYTLNCLMQDSVQNYPDPGASTQLTVRYPSSYITTEF